MLLYQRPHQPSPQALAKPYRFLRLPMQIDATPLVEELADAPLTWLPSQWKWHLGTDLCILRAGQAGKHPGSALVNGTDVDAPILTHLPRLRAVLNEGFPAPVRLAWLGRSPANSCIHLHIDNTSHWDEHHRLHIPLITTPGARLCIEGGFVHMPAGTVWAFNNSRPHGVINTGPDRIHLMVDLSPVPAVEALMAAGEPVEGTPDAAALAWLTKDPLTALSAEQRTDAYFMARLHLQ